MEELDDLDDLEKVQIVIQMFMERYDLTEEEAKKKISEATCLPLEMLSAIDMMSAPAFKK